MGSGRVEHEPACREGPIGAGSRSLSVHGEGGSTMIRTTLLGRQSFAGVRSALAALLVTAFALVTGPIPASATAPAQAERRFTVMTYNVYLGANDPLGPGSPRGTPPRPDAPPTSI